MSNTNTKLDISIVGAGLAGLAAAISCALGGHHVTVYEGAKQLAEIGAGVQITPNASRLLARWGLLGKAEAVCAEPTRQTVHRYADGTILADDKDFSINIRRKFGNQAPFIDMHRIDLQTMLYDRALELGVTVLFDRKIVQVLHQQDQPVIILEDNTHHPCDLVVGADGLWSKCRGALLNRKDDPLPTGDLAYRIVLTLNQLDDSPDLKAWVSNPQCHLWAGPNSHAVGYSLRKGEMFNLVLLVPDDLPADVSRQSGSVQEMRTLFKDWDPVLNRFLDHVEQVDKWKLMHRTELETWVNDKRTFVLIGDSCHNMLPYLAQGTYPLALSYPGVRVCAKADIPHAPTPLSKTALSSAPCCPTSTPPPRPPLPASRFRRRCFSFSLYVNPALKPLQERLSCRGICSTWSMEMNRCSGMRCF